jgi:hypothetical protein
MSFYFVFLFLFNEVNVRYIAILICIYDGELESNFEQMLVSLTEAITPSDIEMRLYLHIDGEISIAKQSLIDKFSPYKIVCSSENVGLAKGLNKLIDVIEDESYFFRMDTDDLILPHRFIKQVEFMDNNPSIDMCGGGISEFIGHKENIVATRTYPKCSASIKNHMIKGSPFAHVTVCFRNDFFTKFGQYPVDYPLNEDIAFWYNSHKKGANSANIESVLVLVRMDNAYSRRTFKKAISEFKVYLNVARWQNKLPFLPLCRLSFRLLPANVVRFFYNSSIRKFFLS